MADAGDSKSPGPQGREGSTPSSGTSTCRADLSRDADFLKAVTSRGLSPQDSGTPSLGENLRCVAFLRIEDERLLREERRLLVAPADEIP